MRLGTGGSVGVILSIAGAGVFQSVLLLLYHLAASVYVKKIPKSILVMNMSCNAVVVCVRLSVFILNVL